MSKTPAAILSDALTAFNRAASLAITAAQDQALKDVTQATADAREARRERDEAVNTLHAYRLEEQAWKKDSSAWKAAANTAALAINDHLETIDRLREEATLWKSQCLRLEETARQEAISWKEQYLRVEQERSKLAQRVEELVQEQLAVGCHVQTTTTPYTPIPRYSAIGDLSASTRLRRASMCDSLSPSLHELPPSKPLSSTIKTTSSVRRTRGPILQQLPTPLSENQRSGRQKVAENASLVPQPGLMSNGTRQIVLRRVHTVVEVPVKEESVERDPTGLGTPVSSSASGVASTSNSILKSITSKASKTHSSTTDPSKVTPGPKQKASAKRAYVEIENEESEQDEAGHEFEQGDIHQPASDGDDELLMGVETNRREVYGMKRSPLIKPRPLQKTTRPLIAVKRRRQPAATKKSRPSATSQS